MTASFFDHLKNTVCRNQSVRPGGHSYSLDGPGSLPKRSRNEDEALDSLARSNLHCILVLISAYLHLEGLEYTFHLR